MSPIFENVLQRIGNTPMVKLNKIGKDYPFDIFVKLEFTNPTGSTKDRIALRMVEEAEKKGIISPGKTTLVEATTGNTGIAISMVATVKGYKIIIVAPQETSENERMEMMKSYGAEIMLVDVSETAKEFPTLPKVIQNERSVHGGYVEFIPRKICKQMEEERDDVWWARQFNSPDNVGAHEYGTGKEIAEQIGDRGVDLFVASVGTGGTVAGVGKALKQRYQGVKIGALEPAGHPILSDGGEIIVEGITDGIERNLVDEGVGKPGSILDYLEKIRNDDAVEMADRLCREEGLFCGVSSGANLFGAVRLAQEIGLGKGGTVVTVLPDSRDRYFTEMRYIT